MESTSFSPFLFLILSIIAGVGGIILLIVGLVFSQKKKWIPGLVVFIVSIIFGITAIISSFRNVLQKIEEGQSNYRFQHWQNTINPDSLFKPSIPVDSNYIAPVSGFIEDNKHSLVYFSIYPHKNIEENALSLQKISKGSNAKPGIDIVLECKNSISKNICLSIYNSKSELLSEHNVAIQTHAPHPLTVNFPLGSSINFNEIDYGTLRIIE